MLHCRCKIVLLLLIQKLMSDIFDNFKQSQDDTVIDVSVVFIGEVEVIYYSIFDSGYDR